MRFRRIIALLVISLLISGNAYAEINNLSTTISLTDWFNTEEGREYIGAGITTYYVGDAIPQSSSLLLMPMNSSVSNNIASEDNPAFTITSQIRINDVNVGENAVRIKENGNLKCLFNIKNNTNEQRQISVVIATYTEGKALYRLSPVSFTLEASEEQNYQLEYVFNPEMEYTGKIMFWDSLAGMIPLRTTIEFSQTNGVNAYYYDLDNHLLQIDKSNGTSLLYTYDKMGNLLRKSVRK